MERDARGSRQQTVSRRALVVDDSAIVRRTLGRLLEEVGFAVDVAASGEEAYERCFEAPYSLVVTDQTMSGLSGTQLCRLLRSDPSTSHLPLVLLTADDDPRSRFRARDAGADAYVAKATARVELASVAGRLALAAGAAETAGDPSGAAITKASHRKPLERLGEVLESVLFRVQIGNEVRSLVEHVADRRRFGRAVARLVAEVAEYDYLVLRLDGPEGPTWVVDARSRWGTTPESLRALGIEPAAQDRVHLLAPAGVDGPVHVADAAAFEIRAADEVLGELRVCTVDRRVGRADGEVVGVVAEELGVVVTSLFLVEETHRLAHTDGLTDLPNRRACEERLAHEIDRAKRQGTPLSVAICDIDHFKAVNDTFGHNVGDAVLREVAHSLRGGVRRVDLVARWGGEEFLVVLPSAASAGGRVVAERLRLRVGALGPFPDGPEGITTSFGVATWDPDDDVSTLVERADAALYRAKQRGRNRVDLA